jgi:hypothetical protein
MSGVAGSQPLIHSAGPTPAAAAIWRYEPLVINDYIKELAQVAGLERTFVRVRFRAGKPEEEPHPL